VSPTHTARAGGPDDVVVALTSLVRRGCYSHVVENLGRSRDGPGAGTRTGPELARGRARSWRAGRAGAGARDGPRLGSRGRRRRILAGRNSRGRGCVVSHRRCV